MLSLSLGFLGRAPCDVQLGFGPLTFGNLGLQGGGPQAQPLPTGPL